MMNETVDCATFDGWVAELAFETVDARTRDELLAHAATCERCAAELHEMSAAADRLTLLAPAAEPPLGFEQRVVESLVGPRDRRSTQRARTFLAAAAAIVVFAVGLGVGHLATDRSNDATSSSAQVRYADLLDSSGGGHGSVSLTGADTAILTMTLDDVDAGEYRCVVHRADGTSVEVASWPIDNEGFGTWAVPIDDDVADVSAVSAVNAAGTTIAVAQLP